MNWTDRDIEGIAELRKAGKTWVQVAQELGNSVGSVKTAFQRHGPREGAALTPKDIHWKDRARELAKKLDSAEKTRTAVEVLAEQVLAMAPKAYQSRLPTRKALTRKANHTGTPQPGVLLFSDTHIGKVVDPAQTLNLGDYNFSIFLSRLKRLEEAVGSIVRDHTTTKVPEIVVAMLGDMLDGALAHAVEAGQENTMLEQFFAGGHALAQFFTRLSEVTHLRIYTAVGNHARWQNQHKMPTENRNSNFDQFLYCYVQALTRDNPRIQWHLDWQPFAIFEVAGHHFFCGHGDTLRGGDKALGIPNHAVGRVVGTVNSLFTRADRPSPNYLCFGHLHRPIVLPHTKGQVILNGAFPGVDGYSLAGAFNSSYPSQKFMLMHPKYGVTASYDIRLDFPPQESVYTLPTTFTCR